MLLRVVLQPSKDYPVSQWLFLVLKNSPRVLLMLFTRNVDNLTSND